MTVERANNIVKSLIGEDDFHIFESSLTEFYNIAQRQIATTVCPIIKTVVLEGGENTLPSDLYRIRSVSCSYQRQGDKIFTEPKERFTLTYLAYPKDVSDKASVFETDPEAQSALPFYAAAQAVAADSDMRRFNSFMDSYNNILENIAAQKKSVSVRVVTL